MANDAPHRTGAPRRRTDVALAAVLAAVASAAALLQLFLGPDIGLADNGDGFRLMCHFDLVKQRDVLSSPLEGRYVEAATGGDPRLAYFSSQQWLTGAAVEAFQLRSGGDGGFDLRASGVLHAGVFGALLGLLFLALPGGRAARVTATVVAVVLLSDVSFVSYFVSPLSEPATFLGLLAVVVAAAWYVRADGPSWVPPVALVGLVAAGAFLALAKSQTAVFAALLVPVLLLRTVPVAGLAGRWKGRLVPAAAAALLLAMSAAHVSSQPRYFTEVNVHHVVFLTLLPQSPDPAATLEELGAAPELARYAGTGYFGRGRTERSVDPAYQAFTAEVERGDVLRHLATEPRYWVPLLREGASAVTVVRVSKLSNHLDERPRDQFQADRPNPSERILTSVGRGPWWVLPLFWTVAALASVATLLRTRSPATRSTAAVCCLLAVGALGQVVVAVVGDGYSELVKHTVLAGYATALLAAIALGAGVGAAADHLAARRRARGSRLPSAVA